jgi:hypothetical protein
MTAGKKLWRNRKERKEWARGLQSEDPGLEVVHPHAAGIDVGNAAHYVAVRPDRDPEPVRRLRDQPLPVPSLDHAMGKLTLAPRSHNPVSQKIKSLLDMNDPRLLWIQSHAQRFR